MAMTARAFYISFAHCSSLLFKGVLLSLANLLYFLKLRRACSYNLTDRITFKGDEDGI